MRQDRVDSWKQEGSIFQILFLVTLMGLSTCIAAFSVVFMRSIPTPTELDHSLYLCGVSIPSLHYPPRTDVGQC